MTPELHEHLLKVEAPIQKAKSIVERNSYTIDPAHRTLLLLRLIDQLAEHHAAMLCLISQDMTGSAFALARSVVEGMFRALWLDRVATAAEVDRFIRKDEIDVGMGAMVKAIDAAYSSGTRFQDLKKKSWDTLNSLTHNGMLQLLHRFPKGKTKPSYTDAQRVQITDMVTICTLVVVSCFLQVRGFVKEHDEVEHLLLTFGPLSRRSTP